jgi:AraC family transcriptional regulator of adaptative response/methylated-DNA-[protein]-cysteine methyltransferase
MEKDPNMNAMTQIDITQDPRWNAVVARDHAADGNFYFSVKTTGVYCRPSCAARRPNPKNVRFHTTRAAAEKAGFRPCKRCKPDQESLRAQQAERIAKACSIIAESETAPVLDDLAAQVGMSPYHFHRVFKQTTGVTPRDYAAAQREKKVREGLAQGGSVTAAIFDAGYNASSRFYEKSNAVLGMTPSAYKAGGADVDIRFALGTSSLGVVLVAQSDKGVCAILLGDDADAMILELRGRFPKASIAAADRGFERLVKQVVDFVDAPRKGLDLPLDMRGTAFQKRVWKMLQKIPAGTTTTYSALAKKMGEPKAVRAVARACATNHIGVAVPCHRVVRNDGNLAGYYWGLERKRALLDSEASARPASKRARPK